MSFLKNLVRDLMLCVGEHNRGRLWALYVMMVLSAALEAFCAGLFVPFTALLAELPVNDGSRLFNWLFEVTAASTVPERLTVCSVLMCLSFLVKNAYTAYFIHYKTLFVRKCHAEMAQSLLESYLYRDYLYHVQRNSSTIIRNVNQDVSQIYANVLPSILTIMVDGIMSAALLAIMLWPMPWEGILAMVVFVVVCAAFYKLSQRRIVKLGIEQRQHSGEMVKWAIQGLGSIKETKVMDKEDYFLAMFEREMKGFSEISAYFNMTRELPKLFIEVAGISMMLAITVVLLHHSENYGAVLPTLSLFAVATFRLLPAINRIAIAFSSIRFHRATLHGIVKDMKDGEGGHQRDRSPMEDFSQSIELRDVRFRYPEGAKDVLNGLSLQIKRGESVALVGNSGAGKTTAVDLILGLLEPAAGQICVDGEDITQHTKAWQRQIGYISQPIYLLDDTVRRNVAFGIGDGEIDDARVWAALAKAQLEEVVRAMAQGLDTRLGEVGVRLSGGQRQRIGIARVLYRDPAVLIFDEATSALDAVTEQEITHAIERLHGEKTIILIAHRLSTVRGCDRIFMLNDGAVEGEGDFETLQRTNARFRHMVELHDKEPGASPLATSLTKD